MGFHNPWSTGDKKMSVDRALQRNLPGDSTPVIEAGAVIFPRDDQRQQSGTTLVMVITLGTTGR
jgi:hypothetical protein